MENLEQNTEMVVETTGKKSKGFIVGMLLAATAAVGALVYKKFRKSKVEEPTSNEEVFEGINEEL